MAQTLYITVAELAEAYDSTLLSHLGSDDPSALGTVGEANAILLNAIERASGEVEASAQRGGRYSLTDLSTIKTADDWRLKGLVATLAYVKLLARRGADLPATVADSYVKAREDLEALRDGEIVFGDSKTIDAGAPEVYITPSSVRGQLGMVSDSRFFPPARTTVAR